MFHVTVIINIMARDHVESKVPKEVNTKNKKEKKKKKKRHM